MQKMIEARNISKKYRIYHEGQTGYATLVDTLSRQFRRCVKKLRHPFIPLPSSSHYEEFWALQNVDLEIAAGDRVGIIGRNGAGKSTLLKILSRIVEPTTGVIKIHGRVASLLEVGTGFHAELTARENVYLNGAILGMSAEEIRKKFDSIVAFSEVEKFLDTPVKRFSSGMYMRLGFGIAAHLDPELLIVDEVLAVGDAQFQEKCIKKLNDLSSEGRTVIFVSHDVGSVLSLCNKGIFLEKGRVKTSGSIDHCVNAYMQTCRLYGQSWEGNAGDQHVRIYRVRLNKEQPDREFCYHGEKPTIEIEYEILKPAPHLVLKLGVWNQRNQQIARSQTSDDVDQFALFNKPGRHQASFQLDASLFHEGEYFVKLACCIHNSQWIVNDDIVLKLPIYAPKKHTQYTHAHERDGIFLGNRWSLQKR